MRALNERFTSEIRAECRYPNVGAHLKRLKIKSFYNAVILDLDDMVVELAKPIIFLAKDGVTITLLTNSTFLAGLALRRAMQLWHDAGKEVRQVVVTGEGLLDANEIGRPVITLRLFPLPG